MVRVVWTKRAIDDLEGIRNYIARDRPMAADRVAGKLLGTGNALDQKPDRGRPVRGSHRELTHVKPYLGRYRVKHGVVEILAVRHQARKRPIS